MPPTIPRSPFLTATYVALSAAAVVGLLVVFGGAPGTVTLNSNATGTTLQATNPTRDRFEERYQLGWRAVGDAGNTGVQAVYLFPGLVESLAAYAERSFAQAALQLALQGETVAGAERFLVTLDRNEALPEVFRTEDHLTLTDDGGRRYTLERWQALTDVSTPTNAVGVAWFTRPSGAGDPQQLTLTLSDLPGTTKPVVISWNAEALRSTPADE